MCFSPLWAIQLELNAISWHWKSGAWRQSAYGKRVLSTNPRWLAALQACRQSVSRWAEELRAGGREARKKAEPGRKPELTEADRKRLEELLLEGPEKLG